MDNKGVFAFIFDSGKLESSFYGEVVFNNMLSGKELVNNSSKMIVSLGDIPIYKRHIDVEPYIKKDKYCTVDFDELNRNPFQNYPYCWIIEDIDNEIAILIDKRLKSTLKGYIGLSRIDMNNCFERKQFWKTLIRDFVLSKKTITCFQDPIIEGDFCYSRSAIEMGYEIKYNADAEYASIEELDLLQSNSIKSDGDLKIKVKNGKDIDRDLLTLNFSIRHEVQISGVLVWRAINDIDKVKFNVSGEVNDHLIEYPFLALYHSSQGIERIQKAIVELICKKNHIEEKEKAKICDLLTSHSHNKLNDWIEQQENIKFNSGCKKLINILVRFYNTVRYIRYSDEGLENTITPEYQLLLELNNNQSSDLDSEIKNSFGRYLGKLCNTYYALFDKLCSELNIYAYELEYDSAAVIVYYNKEPVNLYKELKHRQNAKKEVLYWLLVNAKTYPKYSDATECPLDFDPENIEQYLHDIICNSEDGQAYFDEVDYLYDELCSEDKEKFKGRIELMKYIIDDSCL